MGRPWQGARLSGCPQSLWNTACGARAAPRFMPLCQQGPQARVVELEERVADLSKRTWMLQRLLEAVGQVRQHVWLACAPAALIPRVGAVRAYTQGVDWGRPCVCMGVHTLCSWKWLITRCTTACHDELVCTLLCWPHA